MSSDLIKLLALLQDIKALRRVILSWSKRREPASSLSSVYLEKVRAQLDVEGTFDHLEVVLEREEDWS